MNAARDEVVGELLEVTVGRTITLDLAEVYTIGVVELDAEVGDGPEAETKVLVGNEVGAGCRVEVEVEADVEAVIEVDVEVDVGVDVEVSVEVKPMVPPPVGLAPPGPPQLSPLRQQPYSSFVPRLQYSVGGQPPARSGQQVQVVSIQPDPQLFMP